MRVVWSWLHELCELDRQVSPEEAGELLTGMGLELEGVDPLAPEFSGVVVAQVASASKHPNADKLTVVTVITEEGALPTTVVCGAPNVPEPGGRVLWAKPGAELPGGFKIGTRSLKGVESAGMLCSETELGLGEDGDGIVVLGKADHAIALGADIREALCLDDWVLDLSVPANRPDTLGHLGVARELVAAVGGRLKPFEGTLEGQSEAGAAQDRVAVEVKDAAACGRYIARIIDGLTVGTSPLWLQQRLRGVGVRPISNLVDVTNYVMFELGQPLHAFDFDKIQGGKIVVQKSGEKFSSMTTLDEEKRDLGADDLLICDAERPVALAGVMGGSTSEVGDDTVSVLLESAHFEPVGIRRTAKRVALHSESSYRFERGVDPIAAERASLRAAQLLVELGGGAVAPGSVDVGDPAAERQVSLRLARARQLSGVEFSKKQIEDALLRLDLVAKEKDPDTLVVRCPSYRSDLSREVDLIEEVLRIHGFDSVEATLPMVHGSQPVNPRIVVVEAARSALAAAGLAETISFGFTSPRRTEALFISVGDRRAEPIAIQNPMTGEQSVMRTSLLPNLLGAVSRNLKHGEGDVGLFEVGHVFLDEGDYLPFEPTHAAAVLSGSRQRWLAPSEKVDFFDLKGALERLLGALGADGVEFVASTDIPFLHPGIAARILKDGTELGVLGEVHPDSLEGFDIEQPVFAFELDLGEWMRLPAKAMGEIPRYPAIARDISILVARSLPAATVRGKIAERAAGIVEKISILEDFRDPRHVPEDKKGMLWSLVYRASDRTLTDAEVDAVHEPLVAELLAQLPAERR